MLLYQPKQDPLFSPPEPSQIQSHRYEQTQELEEFLKKDPHSLQPLLQAKSARRKRHISSLSLQLDI